jgi:hypothetical protein
MLHMQAFASDSLRLGCGSVWPFDTCSETLPSPYRFGVLQRRFAILREEGRQHVRWVFIYVINVHVYVYVYGKDIRYVRDAKRAATHRSKGSPRSC